MSDTTKNQVRVGVIGYGFMGQTHAMAYQAAQRDGYPCVLYAIADSNIQDGVVKKPVGNIDTNQQEVDLSLVQLFNDAHSVIEHPEVDLVSVCTHTDTHVDLAIECLRAGKHVLVEKPIAIHSDQVYRLVEEAKNSDRLCIPAMCMRHWPAWIRMREMIKSNEFGAIRSASFHRLGSQPTWASKFYNDQTRSGGALHDLHIHDTDFITHCFGVPSTVFCAGDGLHVTTMFRYEDGPIHVTAQAAWDHQPSVGFQMRCTIVFEQATVDFDINRDDQLIVYQEDQSTPIKLNDLSGYDGEVRWMIDQIKNGQSDQGESMHDAFVVARVLEAEKRSMESGSMTRVEI